ncbi:MAG: hypothetical protein JXB06_04590 [Spirochaetales bacterium]|nr:hypothetical protein [Spirochaetales bacterium]
MKVGVSAAPLILLVLVLTGCGLSPTASDEGWYTVTVSVLGTAYSDVVITVQTDLEGTFTDTLAPASLPWEYHQFSFQDDYSIQVSAAQFASTSDSTSANSVPVSAGGLTLYRVTDSSASFATDADSRDVIVNDDPGAAGASARVCCVIDAQNLYIYGDGSDQNIFDPASYPAPVPYTVYKSHEIWLRTIVTDSDNNQSETFYYQNDSVIDLQAGG